MSAPASSCVGTKCRLVCSVASVAGCKVGQLSETLSGAFQFEPPVTSVDIAAQRCNKSGLRYYLILYRLTLKTEDKKKGTGCLNQPEKPNDLAEFLINKQHSMNTGIRLGRLNRLY